MSKRQSSQIDKEIIALLKEHLSTKRNKKVFRMRGGDGMPLSAWMSWAPKNCKSKIFAVVEGRARTDGNPMWYHSKRIADWVCKRRDLTDFQYHYLFNHIIKRYRGSYRGYGGFPYCEHYAELNNHYVYSDVVELIHQTINSLDPPLSFIVDERFTNLIMLKCLYHEIKGAKK